MRLLKCSDDGKFSFREYLADVPDYAILSHTWGSDGDEVSYKDLIAGGCEGKVGYKKLTFCAKQAKEDGYDSFWIDTCCIDKTSSAELQEAINSMFRWYQEAAVCYVYLSDVQKRGSTFDTEQQILQSRWFTRGWTLQELLAPKTMIFFSDDWQCLGTKLDLLQTISAAANIETRFLNADIEELNGASISKKMSWASHRQTSRIEDEAYCLLGLFGIHIPLLYGEGKNSFRRLQEEIMKNYPFDHTLFAWGTVIKQEEWSRRIPANISIHNPSTPLPWDEEKSMELLLGLFAESLCEFSASGQFTPWYLTRQFYDLFYDHNPHPTTAGKAVRIEIPMVEPENLASIYHWDVPECTQQRKTMQILLLCGLESSKGPCLRIPVQAWGDLSWGRTREIFLEDPGYSKLDLRDMMQTLNVEPQQRLRARSADVIIAQPSGPAGFKVWYEHPNGVYFIRNELLIRQTPVYEVAHLLFDIRITFPPPRQGHGIRLFFVRLAPAENTRHCMGPIFVSLVPVNFESVSNFEGIFLNNLVWFNNDNAYSANPLITRTFSTPSDVWNIDHPSLPRIQIKSERMPIDDHGSSVDVLRLFILEDQDSTSSPTSIDDGTTLRSEFARDD